MVIALVVLIINDQVLKWRFHNAFTGKLSDVAGLVFFPALVVALVELICWIAGRGQAPRGHRALVAGLATAVLFTAVQLDTPVTDLYRTAARWWWGREALIIADPTDLLALPAALVPFALTAWTTRATGRPGQSA